MPIKLNLVPIEVDLDAVIDQVCVQEGLGILTRPIVETIAHAVVDALVKAAQVKMAE